MPIARNCEICETRFTTWPHKLKEGRGRFCSMVCAKTRPLEERFWKKVNKTATCWLWTAGQRGGYGKIRTDKRKNSQMAHRVSWEIHNGRIPDGMLVLHKCDMTLCVNPDHLFLGKNAENSADMAIKDRSGNQKLTQHEVDRIRERYAIGTVTMQTLADEYHVSQGAIQHVVHGLTWKHRRAR